MTTSAASVAGRQLFVGNLPFSVTSPMLRDVFADAGNVVRADVVASVHGRSRGFGTVLFASVDDAQRAIQKFNNYDLNGRRLEVRQDRAVSGIQSAGASASAAGVVGAQGQRQGSAALNGNAIGGPAPAAAPAAPVPAPIGRHPGAGAPVGSAPGPVGHMPGIGPVSTITPVATGAAALLAGPGTDLPFGGLGVVPLGVAGGGIHTANYARTWYDDTVPGFDPSIQQTSGAYEYSNGLHHHQQHHQQHHHHHHQHHQHQHQQHHQQQQAILLSTAGSQGQGQTNVRHLFVGNLPFSATWHEVKDMFRESGGDVQRVEIPLDHQGRSRGFGLVTMATPADARKAISAFNGTMWKGRQIEVREDRQAAPVHDGSFGHGGSGRNGGNGGQFQQRQQYQHGQGFQSQHARQASHQGHGNGSPVPADVSNTDATVPVQGHQHQQHQQQAPHPPVAAVSNIGRQLFIGNLPFSVQWQELKDLFRTMGTVVRADVAADIAGRSRGHGLIVMSTPEEALAAIDALNGTDMGGRVIEVRLDKYGTGERLPGTQIYVGNLPYSMRWQELKDLFRSVVTPVHAEVHLESGTGRSKGYGTVRFATPEDAEKALGLHGFTASGRQLIVRVDKYYAAPAAAASAAAADGAQGAAGSVAAASQ
ncbi:hypothetical protein BC831DRAFT_452131 [Entophlyctis helioformis]|nr:hypothetical protein BC831DRAFT_452131 [Entophlyctis helioformis]